MGGDGRSLPDFSEKLLSSEEIADLGFMRVVQDVVRTPTGSEATRSVVRHCGAVAIIPLFADGDILLVHQYRHPIGSHSLEIPAGKLDIEREEPLACAKRELLEETGHSAADGDWEFIADTYSSVGFCDERVGIFVARNIRPDPAAPGNEDGEHTHPVRMGISELRDGFARGEIKEARTQIALLWMLAGASSAHNR